MMTEKEIQIFNEVKNGVIKIFEGYSNEHGYVDEKKARVNRYEMRTENILLMTSLLDKKNKEKLYFDLSKDALLLIRNLMIIYN